MTELQWCRENAPKALQNLPDDELLSMMHSSYLKFAEDCAALDNSDTTIFPLYGYDLNNEQDRLAHCVTFLSRLLQTNMALKGGYVLANLLQDKGRRTKDIDLDIINQKVYDETLPEIHSLCDYYMKSGLATEYKIREDLSGEQSGGFQIYDERKIVLKCDICSADFSYGLTLRNINSDNVQTFSVERILAEKVLALLSIKRFRRLKDLYDFYCLTNMFDCNARTINIYMRKTVTSTEGIWDDFPFNDDIIARMEHAYNVLRLVNFNDEEIQPKPAFNIVLERFINIASIIKKPVEPYKWLCVKGTFV